MILPFYSTLVRLCLECWVQFSRRERTLLKRQQKAAKIIKRLDHLTYEDRQNAENI